MYWKSIAAVLIPIFMLAAGAGLAAELPPPPAVPGGALAYAEIPNFQGLLADWDASGAKVAWENSAALEIFRRSRLFLKLEDRQGRLGELAGVDLDNAFLHALAGGPTLVAVYDLGRREALAVTRLAPGGGGAALTALTAALPEKTHLGSSYRGRFSGDGSIYFGLYRRGDDLCLATSERLLKEVIRLQKEGGGYAFPDFRNNAGCSFRLDLDLAALRHTSHFQRYWVHGPDGELLQHARLLVAVSRSGGGWTEERLFLDGRDLPAAGTELKREFPPAAELGPCWIIRRTQGAGEIETLLLNGLLRLPQSRQEELNPGRQYHGAAYGTAAGELSDFQKRLDQVPDEANLDEIRQGCPGPGAALTSILENGSPWSSRWAWDLSRAGAPVAWDRQECGLVLESQTGTPPDVTAWKNLFTWILSTAYLANPAEVDWTGTGAPGDPLHCRQPVEFFLESPRAGLFLLATSPQLLDRARRLATLPADAEVIARLTLADASGKYVQFLKDLGNRPGTPPEQEPRLLEEVFPSLLKVVDRVSEIRRMRSSSSGSVYERVEYLLRK